MRTRSAWLRLGALVVLGALAALGAGAWYWKNGHQSTKASTSSDTPATATPDPDLQGPDFFRDVTDSTGIQFTYRNGEEVKPPHLSILESLGGGVAMIDFDGDGLPDLFFPGGGYYDGPDKKQIKGHPCKLYKNLGNGKFKDVTHEVGLDTLAGGQPWFYSHAAAVGDYDRDGWPDLLVTGWGRIALFHNVPDGKTGRKFVDVSAETGLDKGITWATSAAFGDLDGDGYPELYVCQYVDWSWDNNPKCAYDDKTPDVCPPKKFKGLQHKLFQNVPGEGGTRRFKDISVEVGLRQGGEGASKGLGVLMIDVNGDGKPDIYVANDTVPKFLYINHSTPGKIVLEEVGLISGSAVDTRGYSNGSMGLDAGDPSGTGLPALWVTNYENEQHALYTNMCDQDRVVFLHSTADAGIAAIGQKFVGWGTGFIDLENDGWEDIVIADGHAIRYPHNTTRRQKPVLLHNQGGGKFKDLTPRGGSFFTKEHLGRGVALGDLDNDGKIDMVVSSMNEPVAILRNVSAGDNHWVGIDLQGKDFADVVGAKVILEAGGRKQTRFAKGGGSYASSSDRRLVFGLGKTEKINKITVIWPNLEQQEWTAVAIDRYHVAIQGEKELQGSRKRK